MLKSPCVLSLSIALCLFFVHLHRCYVNRGFRDNNWYQSVGDDVWDLICKVRNNQVRWNGNLRPLAEESQGSIGGEGDGEGSIRRKIREHGENRVEGTRGEGCGDDQALSIR